MLRSLDIIALAGLIAIWTAAHAGRSYRSPCADVSSTTLVKFDLNPKDIDTHQDISGYSCLGGELHGEYVRYLKGKKFVEESWSHGKRHGVSRSWHAGTDILESDEVYENGTLRSSKSWYQGGHLKSYVQHTANGNYLIRWYETGEIQSEEGLLPKDLPDDVKKALGASAPPDRIPESIVQKANNYIIGIVGASYFKKNYRFIREKSVFNNTKEYGLEYTLRYEYKPFTKIDAGQMIEIEVLPKRISSRFVAHMDKGKVIDLIVTKNKALKAVKKLKIEGFDENKAEVSLILPGLYKKVPEPAWLVDMPVPSKHGNHCLASILVLVDAVSGVTNNLGIEEKGCA